MPHGHDQSKMLVISVKKRRMSRTRLGIWIIEGSDKGVLIVLELRIEIPNTVSQFNMK